jgi:predicted dehydrogenase
LTRALIVGAGSIGIRHAEVLTSLDSEVAFVSSRADVAQKSYSSIVEAITEFNPDYVVISNPTALHSQAFQDLTAAGFSGRVLVEKPANIASTLALPGTFSSVHVAYNLRFHPVMTALRDELQGKKIYSVQAYAGQDLTAWRPGRDVEEQYSAHASQGGGVLRDLSHELDYLQWLFGDAQEVVALGGRLGDLTVDSDDSWSVLFTAELAEQVSLSINYFDVPGSRSVRVITDTETYFADFIAGTLSVNGVIQQQFSVERNDTYLAMHTDVLDQGLIATSIQSALNTDRLILDIERSATEKIWVKR